VNLGWQSCETNPWSFSELEEHRGSHRPRSGGLAEERDDQRFLVAESISDRAAFGPSGWSSTRVRLRHFATAFGLMLHRSFSPRLEAFDRRSAARVARVVVVRL
jgi:hypothetical protein